MNRWGFVALAIVLAACSGSGAAVPLASGAPPSPVAASPAPSPVQPIVLSGTNSKVTDPINVPPGNYRVSWQASGSRNFVIYIQGQRKDLLVNEILPNPNHGEVLFSSGGGQFIVSVDAQCGNLANHIYLVRPPLLREGRCEVSAVVSRRPR